jgi:glutamate-ammonia-ligase adenylyltransferase
MAVSLEAFRRYFARTGPAWPYERQSLIRMRPIAGDVDLGRQLVEVRDALVYDGTPPDVTAIRAMRERQVRHLVTPGTFNPKFSPGGLVDVEYLVQGLQILHGHDNPDLRATNTREAMTALEKAGVLLPEDYKRLQKAQTFLRWLIEALRVVRGNARDVTIPAFGSDEFSFLGRRLCYSSDLADLKEEMARVSATVRELNARLLG